DTTQMLGALELYGEEPWFRLGDMDLATHLLRTNLLRDGETLTTITARLSSALGISHRILPMTDDEVATIVHTVEHGPLAFQTYFVRHRWQPVLESLSYDGAERAKASADVLTAINEADAIIVGPSNPWLSIAPILALDELRTALLAHDVPRVAVSPIVGGEAIKGPTAKIMQELEIEPAATSVADYYGSVINGFMYDQTDGALAIDGLRTTAQQTVMRTDRDKIALAEALMAWIEDWE
ncbi:MAG: 2-phospho-L-lactate transferase CofD family protein, partial [Chloroflexota bacterium]